MDRTRAFAIAMTLLTIALLVASLGGGCGMASDACPGDSAEPRSHERV